MRFSERAVPVIIGAKGIRGNKSLSFAPSDSLVMIMDIDEEADDVILQQIAQIGTKRF